MFANFVDDHLMQITHVFRGEDHLSNTACQIAFYEAFDATIPIFWHLPIIANIEGKKLSKRDFGFSLTDLMDAGYLSEAIRNYLLIIGGSYKKEILDKQEMIDLIDINRIVATGMIKYDVDKLRWVNHQWILNYNINHKEKLIKLCVNFISKKYPEIENLNIDKLHQLVSIIVPELVTLKDSIDLVSFYFSKPEIDMNEVHNIKEFIKDKSSLIIILNCVIDKFKNLNKINLNNIEENLDFVKSIVKENNQKLADIFKIIRYALTGKSKGLTIAELFTVLEPEKVIERLDNLLNIIKKI